MSSAGGRALSLRHSALSRSRPISAGMRHLGSGSGRFRGQGLGAGIWVAIRRPCGRRFEFASASNHEFFPRRARTPGHRLSRPENIYRVRHGRRRIQQQMRCALKPHRLGGGGGLYLLKMLHKQLQRSNITTGLHCNMILSLLNICLLSTNRL